MSFRHRVYVYGEQQVAAQAMLDECNMFPGGRLQRVNYPAHIMGLDRGTFVVVVGHANPVPAEIMVEM